MHEGEAWVGVDWRSILHSNWRATDDDAAWDWQITYTPDDLAGRPWVAQLWSLCLDGHLEHPPQLERVGDEDVWHLTWDPGTGQPPWQLVIDPASEEPLRTR